MALECLEYGSGSSLFAEFLWSLLFCSAEFDSKYVIGAKLSFYKIFEWYIYTLL